MIIGHVRMGSAAGYYLGSIEVINGELMIGIVCITLLKNG